MRVIRTVKATEVPSQAFSNDPLDLSLIRSVLWQHTTDDIEIELLDSVPSTNAYLIEQMPNMKGTVRLCLAEHQSLGRGRQGKNWHSPWGENLYLSLAWRFNQSKLCLDGLSLALGVAAAKAIDELTALDIALKWPNDLLIGRQKVAGILIDVLNTASSDSTTNKLTVVVGIGLNVNMDVNMGKSHDLQKNSASVTTEIPWTSLKYHSQCPLSRNHLAAKVALALMAALEQFSASGFNGFKQAWLAKDAFYAKRVKMVGVGEEREGIERGVNDEGHLLIEFNGRLTTIMSGDVSLRQAQ